MQTASSSYWNGLVGSLTNLGLDYARARYVDVETRADDRNIPDESDLRYGGGLADERGIKANTVLAVVAGVAVLGLFAFVISRGRR